MKTPFLLVIFIICTNTLFGQLIKIPLDTFADNRLYIKWAPLSILDAYSGSALRLSLEKKTSINRAICFELGTYLPLFKQFTNMKGIITGLEYKYYLNKYTSGDYCSVELFYKYQSYGTSDTIISTPSYYKDYNVSKNVACLNIKYGMMDVYKMGLLFEGFFGLGIKIKDTNSTLSDMENENIQSGGDYSPNVYANKSGFFIYPNLIFGLKIGYKLK